MKVVVQRSVQSPIDEQNYEIVERKGQAHPDSLTDGICEAASRVLSNYYIDKKGFICHHNVDKGLLVGGVALPTFGGGEIIEPPDITVAGTATVLTNVDEIKKLIYEEVELYLEKNMRFQEKLNPDIFIKIHRGSLDLVNLFERFGKGDVPLANDTSFGVGFAPRSKLEDIVYNTERYLNSPAILQKYPFIGEDIKVMGRRTNNTFDLTVAIAFVSKFVENVDDYFDKKAKVVELIKKKFKVDGKLNVAINTADSKDSTYITVTGTSWENGDDGQVGRGNRANGLITPCRTMSLEAVAGKNPVSHIGKIYNLKAQEIAKLIQKENGLREVEIQLLSQIGQPITKPFVGVRYTTNGELKMSDAESIAAECLSQKGLEKLRSQLLKGEVSVF